MAVKPIVTTCDWMYDVLRSSEHNRTMMLAFKQAGLTDVIAKNTEDAFDSQVRKLRANMKSVEILSARNGHLTIVDIEFYVEAAEEVAEWNAAKSTICG